MYLATKYNLTNACNIRLSLKCMCNIYVQWTVDWIRLDKYPCRSYATILTCEMLLIIVIQIHRNLSTLVIESLKPWTLLYTLNKIKMEHVLVNAEDAYNFIFDLYLKSKFVKYTSNNEFILYLDFHYEMCES